MAASDNAAYNGWTNYETWAINAWLMSDELVYNDLMEIITEIDDIEGTTAELFCRFDDITDINEISARSDWPDIDLRKVNWQEIIEKNTP